MTEPQPASPTPAWDTPRARLVARLSLEFVFDVTRISRGQGDILDPLLLTAILDANQAVAHRDPDLALRYGAALRAVPDNLRRPISVNALAKSLRLPFESVRRRVAGWVDAGVCVRTAAGVYIPETVVTSPPYVATQSARVARLRAFRMELVRVGFLAPAGGDALPEEAVRAADRALAQYILRTCDMLIELTVNPLTGFVLMGLSVAGLAGADRPGRAAGLALRQPATVAAICGQLGLPAETVRRHLLALAKLGVAEHTTRGWRLAPDQRNWPKLGRLLTQNEVNLRRLFQRLGDLEAEQAACA